MQQVASNKWARSVDLRCHMERASAAIEAHNARALVREQLAHRKALAASSVKGRTRFNLLKQCCCRLVESIDQRTLERICAPMFAQIAARIINRESFRLHNTHLLRRCEPTSAHNARCSRRPHERMNFATFRRQDLC